MLKHRDKAIERFGKWRVLQPSLLREWRGEELRHALQLPFHIPCSSKFPIAWVKLRRLSCNTQQLRDTFVLWFTGQHAVTAPSYRAPASHVEREWELGSVRRSLCDVLSLWTLAFTRSFTDWNFDHSLVMPQTGYSICRAIGSCFSSAQASELP